MPELTLLLGLLFIAGSLGCERPRQEAPLDNTTVNAGLDPKNPRILALVDYFEAHGIELVHDTAGWWRVTPPATAELDVIVSLRSFPEMWGRPEYQAQFQDLSSVANQRLAKSCRRPT